LEGIGIDISQVSIIGASLNAAEGTEMSFQISKPNEDSIISVNDYRYVNTIQFDLSLQGANNGSSYFSVPARITIPIPAGIDIDKLEILHYHEDGTYEVVTFNDNVDGTVSFTVIELSPFIFAEIKEVDIAEIFNDISRNEWYTSAVQYVYTKGIMTGKGNIFDPAGNITRAEFATTLYSIHSKPDTIYQNVFTDIPDGEWYTSPVMWAYQSGITSGYGDMFGVSDYITREQLVMMLYKYATEVCEYNSSSDAEILEAYSDKKDISFWAGTAMRWAVTNGIISGTGDGRLNPLGNATRAECAAILRTFCNVYSN